MQQSDFELSKILVNSWKSFILEFANSVLVRHRGASLSKQHTADLLLFMAHSRINAKPGKQLG